MMGRSTLPNLVCDYTHDIAALSNNLYTCFWHVLFIVPQLLLACVVYCSPIRRSNNELKYMESL
jgi:hypothetical protein